MSVPIKVFDIFRIQLSHFSSQFTQIPHIASTFFTHDDPLMPNTPIVLVIVTMWRSSSWDATRSRLAMPSVFSIDSFEPQQPDAINRLARYPRKAPGRCPSLPSFQCHTCTLIIDVITANSGVIRHLSFFFFVEIIVPMSIGWGHIAETNYRVLNLVPQPTPALLRK